MRDMKANHELMAQLETLKASTDWGKNASTDWKKMVGMLIPEGANVKILTTVIEPSTRLALRNKFTAVSGKEITGTVVKRAKLTGRAYGGEFKKLVKLQEDLIRNKGDNNLEFSPEHIQLIETEAEPAVTEAQGAVVAAAAVASVPEAEPEAEETGASVLPGATREAEPADQDLTGRATGEETQKETVASGTGEAGSPGATGEAGEAGAVVAAVVASAATGATEGGSQRLTRKNKKSIGAARKTRTNH